MQQHACLARARKGGGLLMTEEGVEVLSQRPRGSGP
jgi:hypothetical protein